MCLLDYRIVRVKKTTLWLNKDTHIELKGVLLIVHFSVDDRGEHELDIIEVKLVILLVPVLVSVKTKCPGPRPLPAPTRLIALR